MKAKRLALPLIIGLALVYLVLVAPVRAQADYYLYPAAVYDYEAYVTTSESFTVSGNDLLVTGDCTYDGGWTSCGASMAIQRPLDVSPYGVMVDWNDGTVATQEFPRPQATGDNISGQGSVLSTDLAAGCANPGACPSPYQGRICYTDLDSGDLTELDCDEESDIWLTEAISGTHDSLTVFVVNNTGGTLAITVDVTMYWIVAECPVGTTPDENNVCEVYTPPPPTGPVDPGSTCSFNYTSTITTTSGTTGTATYSYTIPANLVSNYSFEEDDGLNPSDWTVWGYEPPIGVFTPLFYGSGIFDARTGLRYFRPGRDNHVVLYQDMPLYSSGIYRAGFYYRCGASGGSCSSFNSANLNWGGTQVAHILLQPSTILTTYQAISGTRATGGGSAWLEMELTGPMMDNDEIFVDDLFIWPVDEDGEILCDPDYYPVPPGQPITTTVPIDTNCAIQFGDVCFPAPGDNSCWDCQRPTSLLELGRWISWLACQIRNLFFCHLYNWLLALGNLVLGVFGNVFSFLAWLAGLPNVALAWLAGIWQDVVTWIGGAWQNIWAWVSNVWSSLATGIRTFFHSLIQRLLDTPLVQFFYAAISRLELLLEFGAAAFAWFLNALRTLGMAIINLIELIIDLFQAVIQAFIDPEYDWSLVPGANPDGGFLPGDLGGDGPSPQKVLWLILLGLGTMDASIGDLGVASLQYIPIGLLSIGLILWTLKKWEAILPAA